MAELLVVVAILLMWKTG
ncbi:hypothetical protein LI171_06285 [Emergencia timonensis]|uniref:Uncharacterized protein n=1 Tax=Emergencia timonensis TaxID=1776384 RepID=A0A415E8J0_9FIRM|nr:hypothetical protein [Clostridiales bacterium]MCB6475844.1 hypothetical protein [Emergencia timonensis]RHJ90113.1 hypothetical protein DW099_04240 [Emergencia timonensis]